MSFECGVGRAPHSGPAAQGGGPAVFASKSSLPPVLLKLPNLQKKCKIVKHFKICHLESVVNIFTVCTADPLEGLLQTEHRPRWLSGSLLAEPGSPFVRTVSVHVHPSPSPVREDGHAGHLRPELTAGFPAACPVGWSAAQPAAPFSEVQVALLGPCSSAVAPAARGTRPVNATQPCRSASRPSPFPGFCAQLLALSGSAGPAAAPSVGEAGQGPCGACAVGGLTVSAPRAPLPAARHSAPVHLVPLAAHSHGYTRQSGRRHPPGG